MLKTLLYLGMAGIGVAWALFSPLAGAIACTEAYLLNPKAIQMDDFGFRYQLWTTVAFLIGLIFHARGRLLRAGRENSVLIFLWIFVALCAVSFMWAEANSRLALDASYEMFKPVLVASAFVWAIRSVNDCEIFVTAMIIGITHAAVLHTFGARFGYINASLDRENGVMLESQPTCMLLFVPILILIGTRGAWWHRILAWAALPFVLNSIVKSYQRAAFVALVVEAAMLMLVLPKKLVVRILPLGAILAVIFLVRLTPENYWNWIATVEQPTREGSAASRFVLAETSLHVLSDHPLGVGYKNYQFVSPRYLRTSMLTNGRRSAHNSFFAVLCEAGPQAFVPWILAIASSLVIFRRIRKISHSPETEILGIYAAGFEIGIYGWLVIGLFHDVHDVDPAYWFMGLAVLFPRLMLATEQTAEDNSIAPPGAAGAVYDGMAPECESVH